MSDLTLVLLPGLNGTAGLFDDLINHLPVHSRYQVIDYPGDEVLTYKELEAYVLNRLSNIRGDYVLLGESFSAKIAFDIARQQPVEMKGLILVAGFIESPYSSVGAYLPWGTGFSKVIPFMRQLLADSQANTASPQRIFAELDSESHVLLSRIKLIFSLEKQQNVQFIDIPALYLQGKWDLLVPGRHFNQIRSHCSQIQRIRFNTGHFILQNAPKSAAVAIENFMNTLKGLE